MATASPAIPTRIGGSGRGAAITIATGAAVVMAGAQIAIPLTARRAGLSSVVVVALAVCALGAAAERWGVARALTAAVLVGPLALAAEVVGTRTGLPFGTYHYTGVLRPTVAGVPAIVPLAWLGMGVAAWEVAGRVTDAAVTRIVVGAIALTGWDLFLDPQMTHERYWVWDGGGPYRHIPLSNYAGWIGCSLVVMGALALALPGRRRSLPLLGLFTWMAVMETIGFVVFFGDPAVGIVGAVVTLPLAGRAWRRSGMTELVVRRLRARTPRPA